MPGNALNFFLVIIVSLFSVVGNSLFRLGLRKTGLTSLNPIYLFKNIFNVILQPLVLLGLFIFGVGALIWFRVLTQEPLNKSYPVFVGFTIVFLVLNSYFLLNEPLSVARIGGAALIIAGTFLTFLI